MKIVLLSGIPASGKSCFGKWLQKEKGFIYWDYENETLEDVGQRADIYIGTDHDFRSLLAMAGNIKNTVVIDWGFPPDIMMNEVRWLKEMGADIWWFDGDRDVARASFLKRATVSEALLDIQMGKIERYWRDIKDLFGENMLNVISAGPVYIQPEELYKMVFGK